MVTGAGLDEHHPLDEDVSLWTLELHLCGDGAVRGAAAVVGADATELWSVESDAGAAGQLEAHKTLGLRCANALPPPLDLSLMLAVTGSDHADPALSLQLAALVVIGDTGGHAHAAGGRALAPLCGLNDAVIPGTLCRWSMREYVSEVV